MLWSICFHFSGIHRSSSVFDPISPTYPRRTAREQLAHSLGTLFATSLCTPYFPRLGVRGFPTLRLLCPIRHFLRHRGFVGGSLTYSPLPFASVRKLPVFTVEDSNKMGEVACCWVPRPRFAAPQSSQRVHRLTSVTFGETSTLSRLGPASCVSRAVAS